MKLDHQSEILRRLRCAAGHLDAVISMMETGQPCEQVLHQLNAVQATMRKVKQNLFWAFVYNTLGIPLGAGLFYPFASLVISPEIAGLMMAVSSISVTLNTLLLKGFKPSIGSERKPKQGSGSSQLRPIVAPGGDD